MMAKTMKRMFALILAVSMVMSLSVNAFAADDFKVICGKDEHLHDEDCYEQIMQCGKEAGDPDLICTDRKHAHDDACYAPHDHTRSCRSIMQICSMEEHLHSDDCFAVEMEDFSDDMLMLMGEDESCVWDEVNETLTLTNACITESITVPDGYTVIVNGNCKINVDDGDAITCEGDLTIKGIKGDGELILRGANGIVASSVSIKDIDVDFDVDVYGIQVYNEDASALVKLTNVAGSIEGGYAGIHVNGECAGTEAAVVIDGCDLDITSTATSYNDRARKSGITVYVSKAEKVESSITITDSVVNAMGSDAGLTINNYLGDADATNSACATIDIIDSTVVAKGTNGTWSGIFASVLGQHPDADAIINIIDSSVYALSTSIGIMTSSQKGEARIMMDNSILGVSGKTALNMKGNNGAQVQKAELTNGSTYVQMTPMAAVEGNIIVDENCKTIIATAGDGISYDEEDNYFVIPQGSAVTESFTDGTSKDYTFNNQAGGVGGFDYEKEEIWGFDVAEPEIVPVCKIVETGVEYETLAEAVADANALEGANTIVMLKDIDFDADAALSITGELTITGGKTISRGDYTKGFFSVPFGSSLTLDNIVLDGGNNWTFLEEEFRADAVDGNRIGNGNVSYVQHEEGAVIASGDLISVGGKVVLDNGTTIQNHAGCRLFYVGAGAELVTNDVTITHNTRGGSAVVADVDGSWIINGTVISDNHCEVGNGVVAYMRGTCVMNGGEIYGNTGEDCNGSVMMLYTSNASFTMNDGRIYDNGASYGSSNGWNPAFYVYGNGSKFTMNDGSIEGNYSDSIPGIANNGPNALITLNGGKILNTSIGRGFTAKDVYTYAPVVIEQGKVVDSGTNGFYNNVTNAGTLNGDSWFYSNEMTYSGGGTFNGNVTVQGGAETTMADGCWINGMVTVKAVGNDSTLTVKPEATIDGIQVRVLNSVESGDYTNATEATAAQAAAYVEEAGATVESPVLYYHRLTDAQKNNIVVTYDYNGGLDASGWSGCQITSDASFIPTAPAPTKGSLKLTGWAYAEDNKPESLSMDTDGAYNGEKITQNVRLIAQWEEPEYVCYIKETGVYYETLTEAVADANAEEGANTIVMIKNIDFDSTKALSVTGELTIVSEENSNHVISRGDYTGTLFTVPAGSSLTLDGGIVFDGSNDWIFNKNQYNTDLYDGNDNPISEYAYSAEGGTCGTAAAFVVNGEMTAKDATIQNFFNTKDSNDGDGAIFKVNANATLTTDSALIDHVATYGSNSVAHLASNAKWYIKGDTMISNTFAGRNGGVCRNDSGQIYMSGGTIKNNAGKNVNGSVFMMYGTGSQFIMTGGTICGNSSVFGSSNGRCAAVYLHSAAYMKMTGGSICRNIGGTRGGIDSYKTNSVLDINRVDQDFDNAEWKESGAAAYTAANHPVIADNVSLSNSKQNDVGYTESIESYDWWVTGGIYTQDVDEFCAKGYVCIPYEDSARTDDYIVVPGYRVNYHSVKTVELTDPETGAPVTDPETGAVLTETQTELEAKRFLLLPNDKFWYEVELYAEDISVTKTDDDGKHVIDTWFSDVELSALYDFESPVVDNLNLYGTWEKSDTYTVTYEWSGLPENADVDLPVDSKTYYEGDAVTVDRTYAAGNTVKVGHDTYTFSGWNSGALVDGKMPASNVTITGTWELTDSDPTYKVTYSWNLPEGAEGTLPTDSKAYYAGDAVTVDSTYTHGDTVKVGHDTYTFSGWDKDDFTMGNADVTITGTWSHTASDPIYKVTYSWNLPAGAEGTLPTDSKAYYAGDAVTVDSTYTNGDTVKVGHDTYTFSGWNSSALVDGKMPASNVTITGTWTKSASDPTYKVTYSWNLPAGAEGTLPTDSKAYYAGDAVSVDTVYTNTSTVKVGHDTYTFSGWNSGALVDGKMPASNVTITGSWSKSGSDPTYTVVYSWTDLPAGTTATLPTDSKTYYAGDAVSVDSTYTNTSTVKVGHDTYTFSGWNSSALVDGKMPASNVTITGSWSKTDSDPTYKVTYSWGTRLPSGAKLTPPTDNNVYYEGDTVIVDSTYTKGFVATVGKGNGKGEKYVFSGWDTSVLNDGKMPASDVVIEGSWSHKINPNGDSPEKNDETVNIESDIPLALPSVFSPDHYAYIIGYTDGTVRPTANITRAEVATIFFRLLTDEVRNAAMTTVNDFSDVTEDAWYNTAISTMAIMGIINGYPDGTFRPNANITRAEFAAIAARFDVDADSTTMAFVDVKGHWAENEIGVAANNGWVNGYEDGTFRPDQSITRAEAVTLINRVLVRNPETEDDLLIGMRLWIDNADPTKWYYLAIQEATNSHDYERKENGTEFWTSLIEDRDWSLLEQ